MKFRFLFSAAFVAAALTTMAQTHVEGREYYKANQLHNAKELLVRNLNNAGTDKAVSNYYLGLIALEEGKDADAASHFNAGIQANPEYAYNYVGLGACDLRKKDKSAAEKNFKTAEGFAKKDAELQIDIARAYYDEIPCFTQRRLTNVWRKHVRSICRTPTFIFLKATVRKMPRM